MADSNVTHGETIDKGIINSTILYDFSFSTMGQEFEWSCWYACTKILFQWAKETGIDGYSPDGLDAQLIARAWGSADDLRNCRSTGSTRRRGSSRSSAARWGSTPSIARPRRHGWGWADRHPRPDGAPLLVP